MFCFPGFVEHFSPSRRVLYETACLACTCGLRLMYCLFVRHEFGIAQHIHNFLFDNLRYLTHVMMCRSRDCRQKALRSRRAGRQGRSRDPRYLRLLCRTRLGADLHPPPSRHRRCASPSSFQAASSSSFARF